MSKKTYYLEGFNKGQFISWFVTTQSAGNYKVKLYDSKKTYFEDSKNTTDISEPLAMSAAELVGDDLKLEISVNDSDDISAWFNNTSILSATTAIKAGQFFTLSGEDGYDEDYNDICVSLVAWNKKG